MKAISFIIILITFFITGCAKLEQPKIESIKTSTTDLVQYEKVHAKTMSEAEKLLLDQAVANLKDCVKTNEDNVKLIDKLQSEAKEAGAGKMAYIVIGFLSLVIVGGLIAKITKII